MAGDSIRVRTARADGGVEVKVLIRHPMKSRVVDDSGATLAPPHHITDFRCSVGGDIVCEASIGTGISKNPFFSFVLPPGVVTSGTTLRVEWTDNRGVRDVRELDL